MKNILTTILTITSITACLAQDLRGAWISESQEDGKTITTVAILADGYQVATSYDLENKEFTTKHHV